jgi:5-methylcytosine-specific restriction protein A|tara:strand:- start:52 stop:1365 length:1314 start_codon:yes stop_codon:yes gene_type:complete
MNKIILQPAGSKDAYKHYIDTVKNPVDLDRIKGFARQDEYDKLLELYKDGKVHVWGVTSGSNSGNYNKWVKINEGDVALFAGQRRIFATAVVTYKIHNKDLALDLWKTNPEGETWECIYFLEKVENINIPYSELNEVAGYAPNYTIYNFNVLNVQRSRKIFGILDLKSRFVPGTKINNDTLCDIFKCSSQGGMRKSNTTNTLVIISNHVKSIYDDRWIGDQFHYTGMGLEGDQRIDFSQNRTLSQSRNNDVELHLFEVFIDGEYTYFGLVELAGEPYQENQLDVNGHNRTVWMFPLRLLEKTISISQKDFEQLNNLKKKKAKRLSLAALKKRAKMASKKPPGKRRVTCTQPDRNEDVSEYAKVKANGICQLCETPAPFKDNNNDPFLEAHHIIWLSKGGLDTIENTVALCPNCHRKMHIINERQDILFLVSKAKEEE